MNCQCDNNLEFTDNSIKSKNGRHGKVIPIYYCSSCNVVYDGYELDCNNEYILAEKKYIKWFKK